MELVRGQQIVLWGTIKCSNYHYAIRYTFRDDGTILLALGATGQNLSNQPEESHMHNALWRIEPTISASEETIRNQVYVMSRKEPSKRDSDQSFARDGRAEIVMTEFNAGIEGPLNWVAEEFTMLNFKSNLKNQLGMPISYDVMIDRPGLARHYGAGESALLNDYYVTPYDPGQTEFRDLTDYVKSKRSIRDERLVLWCSVSMQHDPRAEDGIYNFDPATRRWRGATLVMWSTIELRPRNLFELTPFY